MFTVVRPRRVLLALERSRGRVRIIRPSVTPDQGRPQLLQTLEPRGLKDSLFRYSPLPLAEADSAAYSSRDTLRETVGLCSPPSEDFDNIRMAK